MAYPNDEWQRKGATLSDKTARQEFGPNCRVQC